MRKYCIPYVLTLFFYCFFLNPGFSQARLVLNGAKINIRNGANLVMHNPAANAITRNDGHIISEGENNNVKWIIGETTGSYTVPWGFGNSDYLPLTFTKSAGVAAGNFLFSTYRIGWQNSLSLPSGVTQVLGGNTDNSAYIIDRFWQINAQGYTTKPSLTDVNFGYIDTEHSQPDNTITESLLTAQRWNDDSNIWSDMPPAGTANIATNTVTVSSVNAGDLYKWWTLVDVNFPLPLHFLSFHVQQRDKKAELNWTTTSEMGVKNFEIQRSTNGINFTTNGSIDAKGGYDLNKYEYIDELLPVGKLFYYRIKENDLNASFTYSEIRTLIINRTDFLQVYPNPVYDQKIIINSSNLKPGRYFISLFDLHGRLVFSNSKDFNENLVELPLNVQTGKGVYLLKISNESTLFYKKIMID